ncbi:hypothetical protein BDV27DRAFT_152549 [Aspergillus caelatus]|uniref:Uncharacterized protein n=1 Tax=Aspergillus caelatus TaxID=61420 RepID=A0A5N7AJ23_9EURO|nr:uncharacterized protein BDV27DRAFT_152549 [Aspergillus caelatus]KAE8369891.1 hypothetical protein BDV27DRAFT_152549 [Aspergillus caelatus]
MEEVRACVSTGNKGIISGGCEVANDKVYEEYLKIRKSDCLVRGGAPDKAGNLAREPTSISKFDEWQKSRRQYAMEALLAAKAESLGVFVGASSKTDHLHVSQRLKDALDYFSTFQTLSGRLWAVYDTDSRDATEANSPVQTLTCSITPFPGQGIRPGNASGWKVTQQSPSSIKLEVYSGNDPPLALPVSIIPPMVPVNLTLGSDMDKF